MTEAPRRLRGYLETGTVRWSAGVLVLVALGAGLRYLLGRGGAPSPNAAGTATVTAGAEASTTTDDGSSTRPGSRVSEARPRVAVLHGTEEEQWSAREEDLRLDLDLSPRDGPSEDSA